MSKLTVTIIGCGWLGRPLGERLNKDGYIVHGSTRNSSFFDAIKSIGIQPFLLDSYVDGVVSNEIIESTNILIITLPPTSRNKGLSGIEQNREFMEKLLAQFNDSVRVIYTSSTGVYPKKEREYYESYSFSEKEQQTTNYQLEFAVQSASKDPVILRLGGLIGPNRHPIFALEGRENLTNPKGVINFVHRNDVIEAISKIIDNPLISGIFNVVNPMHPSRESYYRGAAKYYGLIAPTFSKSPSIHRTIISQKIVQQLDFKFKFAINRFPKIEEH